MDAGIKVVPINRKVSVIVINSEGKTCLCFKGYSQQIAFKVFGAVGTKNVISKDMGPLLLL